MPFDWFEDVATAMADRVVANSKFTAGVVENTFVQTSALHSPVSVVYPCVQVLNRALDSVTQKRDAQSPLVFLSINRFERKKALHIAVQAMCELKGRMQTEQINDDTSSGSTSTIGGEGAEQSNELEG